MAAANNQANNGKVLAFKKEGEFFYKRGVAMLEKNKILDAVSNFSKAVEINPENEEYVISLAESFSNIGYYDESNRVIFAHFPNLETRPADGFFGLGCNFAAMMDYENAKACIEQYLSMEPDGEYACDACDMLEAIFMYENEKAKDKEKIKLHAVREPLPSIHDVIMAEDDDEKFGVEAIEKRITKDKKLFFLRNLLTIKFFLKHDYKKAEEYTNLVLQDDLDNVHAHCNRVMIASASNNDEMLNKELDYIRSYRTENMNELNRIGLTLLEYSTPDEALPVLKHMYSKLPYDKTIMHKLAICYYALKEYKKSIELYDKLIKLDEKDDIAFYYRNICACAQNNGITRGGLVIDYEVPMDEVVERVSKIKDFVRLPFEEQLDKWKNDAPSERLIVWGTRCHDIAIKRAMLTLVSTFADKKAEILLRKFLLHENENDDLKREVFGLLAQMQAESPFIGYIGGALIESHVDRIEFMEKIPKIYRDILTNSIQNMESVYSGDALLYATHLWKNYLEANNKSLPQINKNQGEALSVVIEYFAVNKSGAVISKQELCEKYNISSTRFDNAYLKLEPFIEITDDELNGIQE
ncbi:MAG: tetratricopeptide repeat protein [Clostridia bacterium]|nr:tetratricopeptide repeat protein [Clostridia bacterium]